MDPHHLCSSPYIIILGGWSPGPLEYLKQSCPSLRPPQNGDNLSTRSIEIVEPKNLPMPPIPGSWCCHPSFFVMLAIFIGLLYLSASHLLKTQSSVGTLCLRFVAILFSLLWLRILVAVVVRQSIDNSIQILQTEIAVRGHPERAILVGFSWGGAVLAEMLARGLVGGKHQPSAVLLAPTTSLVAKATYQTDVPLRLAGDTTWSSRPSRAQQCDRNSRESADSSMTPPGSLVHVIHGSFDESSFCPNQQRWRNVRGSQLHILSDNHVLCRPSTIRHVAEVLENLLSEFHRYNEQSRERDK